MAHDGPPDDKTRRLAQEAMAKRRAGRKPTREELSALKRMQRFQDEQSRERHYREIPKKDWCRLSGRQHKVIDEQARRYGIPLDGPSIDLYKVATWIHTLLAEKGRKLTAPESEAEMIYGGDGDDSPWLEKLRKETALCKRLDRLEREKQLIKRDEVHAFGIEFARQMKSFGDDLQAVFGPEALEMLNDKLVELEQLTERTFSENRSLLEVDEEDEDSKA